MDFDAVIVGDRQVVARFDEWPKEFYGALHARIAELILQVEGRVRAETPVGKTGRLQASIGSDVHDYPTKIVGKVYSGMSYAPAIEFGVHKSVSVRGHERQITKVFGNPISPEDVFVEPYSRMADIEARRFMSGGLHSMEGEIAASLEEALERVTAARADE